MRSKNTRKFQPLQEYLFKRAKNSSVETKTQPKKSPRSALLDLSLYGASLGSLLYDAYRWRGYVDTRRQQQIWHNKRFQQLTMMNDRWVWFKKYDASSVTIEPTTNNPKSISTKDVLNDSNLLEAAQTYANLPGMGGVKGTVCRHSSSYLVLGATDVIATRRNLVNLFNAISRKRNKKVPKSVTCSAKNTISMSEFDSVNELFACIINTLPNIENMSPKLDVGQNVKIIIAADLICENVFFSVECLWVNNQLKRQKDIDFHDFINSFDKSSANLHLDIIVTKSESNQASDSEHNDESQSQRPLLKYLRIERVAKIEKTEDDDEFSLVWTENVKIFNMDALEHLTNDMIINWYPSVLNNAKNDIVQKYTSLARLGEQNNTT